MAAGIPIKNAKVAPSPSEIWTQHISFPYPQIASIRAPRSACGFWTRKATFAEKAGNRDQLPTNQHSANDRSTICRHMLEHHQLAVYIYCVSDKEPFVTVTHIHCNRPRLSHLEQYRRGKKWPAPECLRARASARILTMIKLQVNPCSP
jgi:hypothetical protein